jgi:hypothetical protein
VLLSRKEVDMLYVTLEVVTSALEQLGVDYIVTGGSLLGAVRQHSILFCVDDIDIAIIERDGSGSYEPVPNNLQSLLGPEFAYSIRPWEGGPDPPQAHEQHFPGPLHCSTIRINGAAGGGNRCQEEWRSS